MFFAVQMPRISFHVFDLFSSFFWCHVAVVMFTFLSPRSRSTLAPTISPCLSRHLHTLTMTCLMSRFHKPAALNVAPTFAAHFGTWSSTVPATQTALFHPHKLHCSTHTNCTVPLTQAALFHPHKLHCSSHTNCTVPPTQTALFHPHKLRCSTHTNCTVPATLAALFHPKK